MKIHYVPLTLLTLLVVSNFSTAQDLQYNYLEAVQEQMVVNADLKARYCMHTTAQTFLANGMRDQQEIVDNLVKVCGGQMKAVYRNFQIPQPELVEPYLQAIAYDELLGLPGVKVTQTAPVTKPEKSIVTKPVEPRIVKYKDGHSEYVVTDPKTGQIKRWDVPEQD